MRKHQVTELLLEITNGNAEKARRWAAMLQEALDYLAASGRTSVIVWVPEVNETWRVKLPLMETEFVKDRPIQDNLLALSRNEDFALVWDGKMLLRGTGELVL